MLKLITSDMFNISKRIKKIDKNLLVFYNKNKDRYEVHYSNSYKNSSTLAFCVGKNLNAFTLKKAYLTSSKNAKKLIKQINYSNKCLREKQESEFLSKHIETLNNYLSYANNKNSDVFF